MPLLNSLPTFNQFNTAFGTGQDSPTGLNCCKWRIKLMNTTLLFLSGTIISITTVKLDETSCQPTGLPVVTNRNQA